MISSQSQQQFINITFYILFFLNLNLKLFNVVRQRKRQNVVQYIYSKNILDIAMIFGVTQHLEVMLFYK